MATKKCCCGGTCFGCCYPYDYLETPIPGNYAQIIRWEIDAPNCPAIDGLSGQFSPETTGPHDPMVECGFCLCYNNDSPIAYILGQAFFENGSGGCSNTPCGINLCLGLQCARVPPPTEETPDRCCQQFRLIVVLNGATPSGGDPVDIRGACFDQEGEDLNGNPNFPGCNGGSQNAVSNATQLTPSSCQCEDRENPTVQPFELVFDLSVLGFACDQYFAPGTPCEGNSKCCEPFNCSFSGATLTATRL